MKLLNRIKNLIFKSCENCYYENDKHFKFHCRDCKKG